MSPTVYLVRHAESVHNVTKDFNLRDPGLTELGFTQASSLASSFPALSSIAIVLTSPLTRAIETTIAGFGAIVDTNLGGETGGTDGGARLVLDPDLQERSDLPCDTGSNTETLRIRFPDLDVSSLGEAWYVKEGANAADDVAVAARARSVRERLQALASDLVESGVPETERAIVVVTHGVFMKFLAGDDTLDLPKAGWKAYTIGKGEEGDRYGPVLTPVE
ncbi:histidine phosphatase superfamily [Chaetomium tenue]|uniref:Histidine phosphatase superfamily n=1 Tax=Chaetomium tenue TaxID=1854479 RepID=A0ACB7NZU3_9PEZI|nr:histidine phosphatase superfamily [Chaetomium globosum]